MFTVQFFKPISLQKIRPRTLIVWVITKMHKKNGIKCKNIFLVLNKYQSLTYVSTSVFQGLLKVWFFRSVALIP